MKRLFTLLLALMLLLSLAACGGDEGGETPDRDDPPQQTQQQEQPDNGNEEQPSSTPGENKEHPDPPDGEIDVTKWLDYLTDTYDLAFTDGDYKYWADDYPVSITENETNEAKESLFKFEDMPMDMQNVLVGNMFTASAALSGNNNLDPASGEMIGNATDDLYFYGDSDPSPTKAWNYTYNNAQYSISIALSSSKYVEMTVTAYKGDAAIGGETPVAAGSYDGPFDDKWPDCVWTRLVPRPEFADKNQMDYSAVSLDEYFNSGFSLDVTLEQAQGYAELLKTAGYTINPKDEFADMGSTVLFTYAAEDENGNYASVGYNSLTGTAISVKKIGG